MMGQPTSVYAVGLPNITQWWILLALECLPTDIYICIPTRNRNNKFILQFILRDEKMADLEFGNSARIRALKLRRM